MFKKQYYEILINLFFGKHKGKPMRMEEGKQQARQILIKRFGSDELLRKVLDIDPTPTNKYAEWIAKHMTHTPDRYTNEYELEALGLVLQKFDNLLKKGIIPQEFRDINRIDDIEMLEDVVYQNEFSEKQQSGFTAADERAIKAEESNIIEDNKMVTVVEPLTHRS